MAGTELSGFNSGSATCATYRPRPRSYSGPSPLRLTVKSFRGHASAASEQVQNHHIKIPRSNPKPELESQLLLAANAEARGGARQWDSQYTSRGGP